MPPDPKLAGLRRQIERLEASSAYRPYGVHEPRGAHTGLSFGDPEIDGLFPDGGLAWGSHQIAGSAGDPAAARAFAAFLLARWFAGRPKAQALIVQEASALREGGGAYGPGLHALGLDPGRLILVQARDGTEVLRLINEALRVRAPEIVIGDLWDGAPLADLSVTRRFNLAAASARVMAVLTTPDLTATSAALTRWQVASAPSLAVRRRLGAPALALDLVRNRHGPTGRWILEWSSHDRAFSARPLVPGAVFGRAADGLADEGAIPARAPLVASLGAAPVDRSGAAGGEVAARQDAGSPFGAYRQAG